MFNYFIILAILVALIALKVTKFVVVAIVAGLLVILLVKNSLPLLNKVKGRLQGKRN